MATELAQTVAGGPPLIMAVATARGGSHAIVRLAGSSLRKVVAERCAGLPQPWQPWQGTWPCAGGRLPLRLLWCPGPRSFTGDDLAELTVPGSEALLTVLEADLAAVGAVTAEPGYFARRALANGRLRLEQAEALLALVHATDAPAAQRALAWLRGSLGAEVNELRAQLLHLRALVEASLDFMEEEDVRAFEAPWMRQQVAAINDALSRWLRTAQAQDRAPVVVLAGPANAGKSALFNALCGGQALVSERAGTTRDWLDAAWVIGGRRLRLVDTAGWLDQVAATALDSEAVARGRELIGAAAVVIWCSAPDARLPQALPQTSGATLIAATKADLGDPDPRAALCLSVLHDQGLDELRQRVVALVADDAGLPHRQQALLQRAQQRCQAILEAPLLPADELLAADLRQAAADLGELVGSQTPDEILGAIFSQFCIGK